MSESLVVEALDATSADRSPDGWLHEECNPSNWSDADLSAFATDGGRSVDTTDGQEGER
jgi:hypothetical protein